MPKKLSNRKFQTVPVITGILVLVYLAINLLVVGGDEFVYQLNAFLVSPLSILTSVTALLLWRQMKTGTQSRNVWGGLLVGWILWAFAELLWAVYSLQGKDPYPSPADFFFLLAYIPLAFGLLNRIRKLPTKPSKFQYAILGSVSVIVGFVTFTYILYPILQSYDPELFLESVLSLFYPLADLCLLLVVLRIFFTFGPGDYGQAWRLILIGFVTVTISDLIYSYADWNGLYYPDSKATFLSTIGVDWLYCMSYLFWAYGIYLLRGLFDHHETRTIVLQPQRVPNTYVLIFTDKDGRVSGVSQNYHRLFPVKDVLKRTLAELLQISEQKASQIHTQFLTHKRLAEEELRVAGASGKQYDVRISGLAIMTSVSQYDGAIILLRLFTEDGESNNELSEFHVSLISNILRKVDNNEKVEISRFLYDYHLAHIMALYNLALHEGGTPMSQSFLDTLQSVSNANEWGIDFGPHMSWDDNPTAHLELPHHAWSILLETAKDFISHLSDKEKVDTCIQEIRTQFDKDVLKTAMRLDGLTSSPPARKTIVA